MNATLSGQSRGPIQRRPPRKCETFAVGDKVRWRTDAEYLAVADCGWPGTKYPYGGWTEVQLLDGLHGTVKSIGPGPFEVEKIIPMEGRDVAVIFYHPQDLRLKGVTQYGNERDSIAGYHLTKA